MYSLAGAIVVALTLLGPVAGAGHRLTLIRGVVPNGDREVRLRSWEGRWRGGGHPTQVCAGVCKGLPLSTRAPR
jgi:hypothetical protein